MGLVLPRPGPWGTEQQTRLKWGGWAQGPPPPLLMGGGVCSLGPPPLFNVRVGTPRCAGGAFPADLVLWCGIAMAPCHCRCGGGVLIMRGGGVRGGASNPPPRPPPSFQNTFGPTEGQNEQWREANRRRQRHTIRYRGLVPTPLLMCVWGGGDGGALPVVVHKGGGLRPLWYSPPTPPDQRWRYPPPIKQDKSSGGSVDTTKTRSGPQRV